MKTVRTYCLLHNDDSSWARFQDAKARPYIKGQRDTSKEPLMMPLYSVTPYENGDVDVRVYETLIPDEVVMEDNDDMFDDNIA